MPPDWYSHEQEVRRLLAETEAGIIESMRRFKTHIQFVMGLVQWLELTRMQALEVRDDQLADGCTKLRTMLRRLGNTATSDRQEEMTE
jgi:hypothetical protein